MVAVTENETEVVSTFCEGGSDPQVGAEPVEVGGIPVEIASAAWRKTPSGLFGVSWISPG